VGFVLNYRFVVFSPTSPEGTEAALTPLTASIRFSPPPSSQHTPLVARLISGDVRSIKDDVTDPRAAVYLAGHLTTAGRPIQ